MYTFIIKHFFKITGRSLYKIKTIGLENYPKEGGALLIPNHNSILDSFLILAAQPRKVRFVIFESFFKIWFLGKFLRSVKMISLGSIKNKKNLVAFENSCEKLISEGEILCIFPEGELPRGGFIIDFKKGFETIAKRTGVNIIPVNIDNALGSPMSFKAGEKKSVRFKFRPIRSRITFNIGKQMPSDTTAFEVRQKIKELEATSFKYRIRKKDKIVKSINTHEENSFDPKITSMAIKSIQQILVTDENDYLYVSIPENNHLSYILRYLIKFNKIQGNLNETENIKEVSEILIKDNITKFFCSKEILKELTKNNSLSQYPNLKEIYVMNGYVENNKLNEENPKLKIYESYGNNVFPIISMNTKDIRGKDLAGSSLFQRLNKKLTVGRIMPGVAVKLVDSNNFNIDLKENEEGRLLIKGFGIEESIEDKSKLKDRWYISNESGFIDSFGFLTITKYN